MSKHQPNTIVHAPLAGLMSWMIPGLGHLYLGHRTRGLVFLVVITATFWSGVAIGGVRSTVDPKERKLWFMAQLCTGGNTLAAWALNHRITRPYGQDSDPSPHTHWMRADVGVHYAGIAGLLNLLVILDAIARADPSMVVRRQRRPTSGASP